MRNSSLPTRMTSGSCVKDTLQVPSEAKAPVQGSAAKAKAKLNSFFENMTISSGCLSLWKKFETWFVRGAAFSISAACPFSNLLQSRLPLITRKRGKTAHGVENIFRRGQVKALARRERDFRHIRPRLHPSRLRAPLP